MEAETAGFQKDCSYPDDILRAAVEAVRDGSVEAVAQALLAERERCAAIAMTITQQEAKVLIKSARLEYWEDIGCHVLAGERHRINFKDAIARKIMRPSTAQH